MMEDTSEYNEIMLEDLSEDSDYINSADLSNPIQHEQICTDNSLDIKLPVLTSIVNKTYLNDELSVDTNRERTNKYESVIELPSIKQEQSCANENDEFIAADSLYNKVILYIMFTFFSAPRVVQCINLKFDQTPTKTIPSLISKSC